MMLDVVDDVYAELVVFFFQAEDGIRDAQESRGLGDVYKRQVQGDHDGPPVDHGPQDLRVHRSAAAGATLHRHHPVSYTHLTLPTIYSV